MITIPLRNARVVPLIGVVKPYPSADAYLNNSCDAFNTHGSAIGSVAIGSVFGGAGTGNLYLSYFDNDGYTQLNGQISTLPALKPVASFFPFQGIINGHAFGIGAKLFAGTFGFNIIDMATVAIGLNAGQITEAMPYSRTAITAATNEQNNLYANFSNFIASNGLYSTIQIWSELNLVPAVINWNFYIFSTDGLTPNIFNAFQLNGPDYNLNANKQILGHVNLGGNNGRLFIALNKIGTGNTLMAFDYELSGSFNPNGGFNPVIQAVEFEFDDPSFDPINYMYNVTYQNDDGILLTKFAFADGVNPNDPLLIFVDKDLAFYDTIVFDPQDADAQFVIDNFTQTVVNDGNYGFSFINGGTDFYFTAGDDSTFTYATADILAPSPAPVPYGGGAPTNPLRLSEIIKLPCFHPCVPHMKKGPKIV